jgi:hypothetical protein
MKIYRMSLLSAGSILLDSTFKEIVAFPLLLLLTCPKMMTCIIMQMMTYHLAHYDLPHLACVDLLHSENDTIYLSG